MPGTIPRPYTEVCEYFTMVEMTGERFLPVKCEDFRDSFAAVHESGYGPSRQILRWGFMSAFGVLRTSCQAGHQAHR